MMIRLRPGIVSWLWLALGLVFCGSLLPCRQARAASGEEFSIEAYDLLLTVDYRWAGTAQGGYYPIRIQVENNGNDCELTFRFAPFNGQQLPIVERLNLPIASGAKANFSLSVPMVGRGAMGRLEVERDGELLDQLTRPLSLSYADHRAIRSSMLIISPTPESITALELATQSYTKSPRVRSLLDYLVIEPVMLPNAWPDYSGVDVIMVPLRVLAELESSRRSAILKWAQTGGSLVIYAVQEQPALSAKLQELIDLPEPRDWKSPNVGLRNPSLNAQMASTPPPPPAGFPGGHPVPTEQMQPQFVEWNFRDSPFEYHDYLLGRVYAFRDNPFPGSPADWAWWAQTIPSDISHWEVRHGVLPRRSNQNFFNFLIPGVTSVPVYAFLVLMTLFTIVIGPLNYILLRRRKRTYLLLLTIPVIAFVTSLTLFVYSTLAYGFSVTSRARSLTVLDQRINTAVSLSRISLFAGMAPSQGLVFSPDTAVIPMWADLQFGQSQFESGRVIWGEQQQLADGWLRSRTRTQFATVQHRTERGRLELGQKTDQRLTVSNGLEWDIAAILWVDDSGRVYQGGELGAGNSADLEFVPEEKFFEKLAGFQEMLELNQRLEAPDDIEEKNQPDLGMMETMFAQFLKIKDMQNMDYTRGVNSNTAPMILPKRSYLAVLAERPGIELGVDDTDERAGYHLLLGHY